MSCHRGCDDLRLKAISVFYGLPESVVSRVASFLGRLTHEELCYRMDLPERESLGFGSYGIVRVVNHKMFVVVNELAPYSHLPTLLGYSMQATGSSHPAAS